MRPLIMLLMLGLTLYATDLARALRDPLSYAPAALVGVSGCLDWASSQRYFAHGWVEANPRFTRDGRRYSEPITPGAGYRRILLAETLPVFGISVAMNTFSYWLEHKTSRWVGRALRWTTAGALASATAPAFSQWGRNRAGTP